jgi:hypothetical protein
MMLGIYDFSPKAFYKFKKKKNEKIAFSKLSKSWQKNPPDSSHFKLITLKIT